MGLRSVVWAGWLFRWWPQAAFWPGHEALAGRPPHGADGIVSALSLGEYMSTRVGELARQKGHDQDAVFKTAQQELRSFPVGRVPP